MTLHELELFQGVALDAGVVFFFKGEFTPSGVVALADAVRRRLDELNMPGGPQRKIFAAVVEMAQNVLHYAVADRSGAGGTEHAAQRGTIAIGDGGDHHWVACSNDVGADQVARLRERLDAIGGMTRAQLREAYVRQLQNCEHETEDPLSRGAGLGLLTIARAARGRLEHSFVPVAGSGGARTRFTLLARLDTSHPAQDGR